MKQNYLYSPHKAYFKTAVDEPTQPPILQTEYVTLWETDEGLVIRTRIFMDSIQFLRPYYYKAQCRLKEPATMLAKWADVFPYTRRNTIGTVRICSSNRPVSIPVAARRFELALIRAKRNAAKCALKPELIYNTEDRYDFKRTGMYCVRRGYVHLLTLLSASKHYYYKSWIRGDNLHKLSVYSESDEIGQFIEKNNQKS